MPCCVEGEQGHWGCAQPYSERGLPTNQASSRRLVTPNDSACHLDHVLQLILVSACACYPTHESGQRTGCSKGQPCKTIAIYDNQHRRSLKKTIHFHLTYPFLFSSHALIECSNKHILYIPHVYTLCVLICLSVHNRTFAIVLSRVLFIVCSNYQEDICSTSWLVFVLLPKQLPFDPIL